MLKRLVFCLLLTGSAFAGDMNFLVMPDKVVGAISPYVYGLNSQNSNETGATFRRAGGNRSTAYNWVSNFSNAGNDWKHTNDNWPCTVGGATNCDQVGAQTTNFVDDNVKLGLDTLMTVPMVDYVAADMKGEVTEAEKAPSPRFKRSVYQKKGAFTLTPNPNGPVVYQDEFVNFLVHRYKSAAQGGIRFYALDNEPDLWSDTHPRVHPEKPTYSEMAVRSEKLASAILKVDPSAEILGFVSYGWQGFMYLSDAPDSKENNETYGSFIDYFLVKMKEAEARNKKRLMHVLDLHWYPEAQGNGKRITGADVSAASIEARLQAPRSLWDPTYTEESWIEKNYQKPIQLIPMVQQKIAQRYPGTKLAFTEYDYGAGNHVSGGLAQADVLGVFGREGVYMASYWGDLKPYNKAALKIYRNYDGKGGAFGNTAVSIGTEDVQQTSVFAATNPKKPGTLWVLVLNKNQKGSIHGKFKIQGTRTYGSYDVYGFDAQSPEIKAVGRGSAAQNQFDATLPPLSARMFVFSPSPAGK